MYNIKKIKNILSYSFFYVIINNNRGDEMATEVTSKTELQSISGDLASKISTLKSDMDSMKSILDSAQDYDGINVTGPAKILKSNLDIIIQDMESVSTNITNYANAIAEFDMDDFTETIFSQDIIKDAADENSPVVQLSNEQTTEVPTNNNGVNATTLQWTTMSGQTGNTGMTYTGGSYTGVLIVGAHIVAVLIIQVLLVDLPLL